MNIKTRLTTAFDAFRGKDYLGHSIGSGSTVSNIFGNGGSKIDVLKEYNGIAWKCIDIRAENLASQDLFVEQYIGKKWQTMPSHPFNDVLTGGNGQYDLSELLEAHEKSMCLYGESFWYFSKGQTTSAPMGIYLLNPFYMTVLIADSKVSGYVYQYEGNRMVLDLDEVEHYRIHDVRNPYRGYGPMQAAGWFVRSARYVNTYVNNFLENNAIPAGVIVAKDQVNDSDWALFKQQWAEKYGGVDNAGKTGFVRGSDLSFVKTGLSLGDVDFSALKNTTAEDIMIMFGISKPMMAIFQDINRASAVTAERLFAANTTNPSLMRLKRKLSRDVSKWYGSQYRIGSSNPLPDDPDVKLSLYQQGVGRWLTQNEARAAYKLEPIDGGDIVNPVFAMSSRDVIAAPTAPTKPVASGKTLGKITIKTKSTGLSHETKENFRSATEDLQLKTEQAILEATNPILTKQKQMVLDQLAPKKVVDAQFDTQQQAQTLSSAVEPLLLELAREQGQKASDFVASDITFKLTPVIEKYIRDSIDKAALDFTSATQDLIAKAVTDGLNAGEGVAKIGKRIEAIYKDVLGIKQPGYRIERLTRTEVIKASNEITETAYKASGVVKKKEWLSNPGACEFCKALNGSTITLGATYVPLGGTIEGVDGGTRKNDYEAIDHPPAHANCRCTLIPVVEK